MKNVMYFIKNYYACSILLQAFRLGPTNIAWPLVLKDYGSIDISNMELDGILFKVVGSSFIIGNYVQ